MKLLNNPCPWLEHLRSLLSPLHAQVLYPVVSLQQGQRAGVPARAGPQEDVPAGQAEQAGGLRVGAVAPGAHALLSCLCWLPSRLWKSCAATLTWSMTCMRLRHPYRSLGGRPASQVRVYKGGLALPWPWWPSQCIPKCSRQLSLRECPMFTWSLQHVELWQVLLCMGRWQGCCSRELSQVCKALEALLGRFISECQADGHTIGKDKIQIPCILGPTPKSCLTWVYGQHLILEFWQRESHIAANYQLANYVIVDSLGACYEYKCTSKRMGWKMQLLRSCAFLLFPSGKISPRGWKSNPLRLRLLSSKATQNCKVVYNNAIFYAKRPLETPRASMHAKNTALASFQSSCLRFRALSVHSFLKFVVLRANGDYAIKDSYSCSRRAPKKFGKSNSPKIA